MLLKTYAILFVALITGFCSHCNYLEKESLMKGTDQTSHIIYEETFEGKEPFSKVHSLEVGDWNYALNYTSEYAYEGQKSVRFEIRKDQPLIKHGKRAEAVIVDGEFGMPPKEAWYSFAVLFPSSGYEYDSQREVINQWYQHGSPATSLRTYKDRLIIETGNTIDSRKKIDLGPIIKDKWQEYVLHFIHSYGADGLIEIWHNGNKILSNQGGNMYDNVLPKWKIGLYKAAFKHGTSLVKRRIIYFDNVRVGNSNATFADMTSWFKSNNVPNVRIPIKSCLVNIVSGKKLQPVKTLPAIIIIIR